MPFDFKQAAAEVGMQFAKAYLKIAVTHLLQEGQKKLTPEEFSQMVEAGGKFFEFGQTLAAKTRTKLDDSAIEVFLEPLELFSIPPQEPGLMTPQQPGL